MSSLLDNYDITAVRAEWIGRSSAIRSGRYPVEYDPIRRHCQMVEDLNPLHLDPEFAAKTPAGAVIAPPVMLDYFAGAGWWPPVQPTPPLVTQVPTPGDRYINLNQEMFFHEPVRVGDHLSSQDVIVDVFVKGIRLDPEAVWVTFEQRITNQHGELVSTIRNTSLAHRDPSEVGTMSTEAESPRHHVANDGRGSESLVAPSTHGSVSTGAPRLWDDVVEGDELPGFELHLSETKVAEQVSGSQDFYPVHHDREFARAGGHQDIFFNTGFTRAALGRLLGDYVGTAGSLRRMQYAMRRMSFPGDTVRARGRVTSKRIDVDGSALVELDIALQNDRDGVTTPGTATVALPMRPGPTGPGRQSTRT